MFSEKLSLLLEKAKNEGKTATQIAAELEVTKARLSDWKAGRYIPSFDNIQKIANLFNVPVSFLVDTETPSGEILMLNEPHILPVYASIRAGNGDSGITEGDADGTISISDEYAKMKVFAMRVAGDSMVNELFDGEIAIFKPINGDPIRNKDIYALEVESWSQWVIKFIHQDSSGMLQLISANKQYPVKEINPKVQNVTIKGKLIESRRIRK